MFNNLFSNWKKSTSRKILSIILNLHPFKFQWWIMITNKECPLKLDFVEKNAYHPKHILSQFIKYSKHFVYLLYPRNVMKVPLLNILSQKDIWKYLWNVNVLIISMFISLLYLENFYVSISTPDIKLPFFKCLGKSPVDFLQI